MEMSRLEFALSSLERGGAPTPPVELIFVGDGPYGEIAAEFLRYFVEVGNLQPNGTVLDIGSGVGRMASGLSLYLDETGSYVGFEPVDRGVRWCKEAYQNFPNFQFHWVDLFNELYNPSGSILPTEFRFPMDNEAADLVIATSIFTHLYEDEIAAYCREIRRVLKPSGRMLATVYVFDGDRPPDSARDLVRFDQTDPINNNRRHIANAPPLAAVCYKASYLTQMMEANLDRKVEIRKGRWQSADGPWYQDLVLA